MDINNDNIGLITIKELCAQGLNFFIPSYQRGYRWTELEVTNLLDDIYDFNQEIDGNFYCLQPLVVKYDNDKKWWRVIDAQQRLTTIFLTLKCLKDVTNTYSLIYERETTVCDFYKAPSKEDNIELFYIKSNFRIINEWLKGKDEEQFKRNLQVHTKFIWYNIDVIPEADEHQMFRNLNSGKIPLTNAELVKALFLKNIGTSSKDKELKQKIIAEEYDQIERKMRNMDFWYFLTYEDRRTSCIELIFDLMFDSADLAEEVKKKFINVGRNKTFCYFDWLISKGKSKKRIVPELQQAKAEEVWEQVLDVFHTLEGWYVDAEIYNLIGYLRSFGFYSLSYIYKLHKGECHDDNGEIIACANKQQFLSNLKKLCWQKCLLTDDGNTIEPSVENLSNPHYFHYENRKYAVNWLLLLHNIATLNIQNSQSDKEIQGDDTHDKKARKDKIAGKVKFSFSSYHMCKWHVEHISPNNAQYKQYWYNQNINLVSLLLPESKLLADDKLKLKLCDVDKKKIDPYIAVLDSSIMTIPNLTLLSEHINTKIGNKSYFVKQGMVLEEQGNGFFVPPCTSMVFTKGYTLSSDEDLNSYLKSQSIEIEVFNKNKAPFWNKEDRYAYVCKMSKTLSDYFEFNIETHE